VLKTKKVKATRALIVDRVGDIEIYSQRWKLLA
jgi:hypothetical protein